MSKNTSIGNIKKASFENDDTQEEIQRFHSLLKPKNSEEMSK